MTGQEMDAALNSLEALLREGRQLKCQIDQPGCFRDWRTRAEDQLTLIFGRISRYHVKLYDAARLTEAALSNQLRPQAERNVVYQVRLGDALGVLEQARNHLQLRRPTCERGLLWRLTSWVNRHRIAIFWITFLGSLASILGAIATLTN